MPHWTSSNAFLSVNLQFVYQWGTLFNHVVDVIVKEWDSILYITIFIIIDDINNYIHKEKKKSEKTDCEKWRHQFPFWPMFFHTKHTQRHYLARLTTLPSKVCSYSTKKKKNSRNDKGLREKKEATARFFDTPTKASRVPFFPSQTPTTRQCLMWSLLCNWKIFVKVISTSFA